MLRSRRFALSLVCITLLTLVVVPALGGDYFGYDDWGGIWCDAEKEPGDDDNDDTSDNWGNLNDDLMCWAAAASNILHWTGWGHPPGQSFQDEDQIFKHFQDHWTDAGNWPENAWHWWFDGTLPDHGESYVDVLGGSFWASTSYRFTDYYRSSEADGLDTMLAIDEYLHAGYGVALWVENPNTDGSHVITCWGYSYDHANNPTGIHVADSDDDKGSHDPPNEKPYYAVSEEGGKWFLGGHYDGWHIREVQALRQKDARIDNGRTMAISDGSAPFANLYIGHSSAGSIHQTGGNNPVKNDLYLGYNSGAIGNYHLSGSGSLSVDHDEFIGHTGAGYFTQTGGTHTVTDTLYLGREAGSTGAYELSGDSSSLSVGLDEFVGHSGAGYFTQRDGTHSVGQTLYLGRDAGSSGAYEIFGGSLTARNEFIGYAGEGYFTQWDGTHTITGNLVLAKESGSIGHYRLVGGTLTVNGSISCGLGDGSLTIDGSSTCASFKDDLYIANSGTAAMYVQNGGTVSSGYYGYIGYSSGAEGTVTVTGTDSTWTNSGALYVGHDGTGALNIQDSGCVSNTAGYIGKEIGSEGTVTVTDASSTWRNNSDLHVGRYGTGTLNIQNGGGVSNYRGYIGRFSGSDGTVTVTGTGSTWTNSSSLYVGYYGTATLNIQAGGSVLNERGSIAHSSGSQGTVNVTGAGSIWNNGMSLNVGNNGTGTLNIQSGGSVSNTDSHIGCYWESEGIVTVDGSGSTWTCSEDLYVGGGYYSGGTGELTLSNGGSVNVGDTLKVWGGGTVNLTDGTLTADSIDHTDGGAFNFTGGWLNVGTFIGEVVNGGGTLAPGTSPGTTNIQGNYTQAVSAAMEIEIGGLSAGTDHDKVILTGTADLAGTLDLSLIDEYVPGFYDEFVILTAGTLNGTFDTITGYSVSPGMSLATVYNADNVTVVAAIPGDTDLDADIDPTDLATVGLNWDPAGANANVWKTGDFDGDGDVDPTDLAIIGLNWNPAGNPVPEPATMLLLALGGLAMIRRRRFDAAHHKRKS